MVCSIQLCAWRSFAYVNWMNEKNHSGCTRLSEHTLAQFIHGSILKKFQTILSLSLSRLNTAGIVDHIVVPYEQAVNA